MRKERRSPPNGPGATDPASRDRARQRIALEALTPNLTAAARQDAPAAKAATTRSRRSTDSAFVVPVAPLKQEQLNHFSPTPRSQAIWAGRKRPNITVAILMTSEFMADHGLEIMDGGRFDRNDAGALGVLAV